MKTLTVFATFEARSGKEAELRAALIGLVAPTRKEAGCLSYDFHSASDNSAKFISYETWASKAQADAHLQSPHVVALLPRVGELCTGFPQITEWERISG
jgi:Uncharacterized conserved protein